MANLKEKNSKFMNCFWDLASDDPTKRVDAGELILAHIRSIEDQGSAMRAHGGAPELLVDTEYTLKRLVRGLASSRESARQGFAACLCELLLMLPGVDVDAILKLIDDNTRITGSMKGVEERDMLFAKLFGYLTIIRSRNNLTHTATAELMDRLVSLHSKKGWIREVVTEALLSLLYVSEVEVVRGSLLGKISGLFKDVALQDMSAWQLMLASGLRHLASQHPPLRKEVLALLPEPQIVSPETIEALAPTLLACTAGFPKIHRVWSYLMSAIFGMDGHRNLPVTRLVSLNSLQTEVLQAFSGLLDSYFLTASHEKKGVAMTLGVELLRRAPVDMIPYACSKAMVRCLLATRKNRKHTLHALAGVTVNRMVEAVSDESRCRLALASSFVHYGDANFDMLSRTHAVSRLLEGLGMDDLSKHIEHLCGLLGDVNAEEESAAAAPVGDEEEVAAGSRLGAAMSSLEALSALTKNEKLQNRSTVCAISATIFVRLACFGAGAVGHCLVQGSSGSAVRAGKKSKGTAIPKTSTGSTGFFSVSGLVTYLSSSERTIAAATAAPEELSSLAATKLLALLTDYGHLTMAELDASFAVIRGEGKSKGKEVESRASEDRDTLLRFAMQLLEQFRASSAAPLLRDDDDDDEGSATAAVGAAAAAAEGMSKDLGANPDTSRLRTSLTSLLRTATFHALACDDLDLSVLADLAAAAQAVVSTEGKAAPVDQKTADAKKTTTKKKKNKKEEEEEEEEEKREPQIELLDACVELLSVSSQQSVKGVKEAVKRVWVSLSSSGLSVSPALVEAVVASIVGDDEDYADNDDGTDFDMGLDGEESDEENGEESEEDIAGDAAVKGKSNITASKSKAGPSKTDALDAIVDDMSDDDDSFGEVQHDESADSALAALIKLKQQSRKNGIMEAKRAQLVNRSRVVDIFEAVIARCDDGAALLPCFAPLVRCLRKLQTQSLTLSLQEGRDFEHRMRILLDQKLCQKRFNVTGASDEEHARALEEVDELLSLLFKLLSGSVATMRPVASHCLTAVARAVLGGNSESCKDQLRFQVQSCFALFVSKKNSKISSSFFDDLLNRFPAFFLSALGGPLVDGCVSTQVAYLKAECFRLCTLLVRRYKSLSASDGDRERFHIVLPLMLDAISQTLGAHAAGGSGEAPKEKEKELRAKRLKPVLAFAKELIIVLKTSTQNGFQLSKLSTAIKKFKQVVDSDISSTLSSSPVVMQLLRNISDSLGSLGTTATAPVAKDGALKRKVATSETAPTPAAKASAKKAKK